jgi:dihydrofolate synthase/folylpolyglutamate synthase
VPAADEIAGDGNGVEARARGRQSGPDRIGCRDGAGSTPRVNAPAARPVPPLGDLIARLSALHPQQIDLSLERMHRLLERLDHPERRLPPVIHVAGTNGKGSTIAYLRAILEAAKLRVHVYTSPHLVRINECFRLGRAGGGALVGDDELRAALEHCERANAGAPITIFEAETAAAFCLFAQHPADVVLLEVGLGGRLDATNVIDAPLATVIAPVGMDHTEFLGDTLTAIAGEKAGIIKRGVPAVCAEQPPEAMAVIEQVAKRLRAPLHSAGQEWHVNVERGRLVYQDERGLMDLAAPKLFGRHQFDNAGLAIAALRTQNLLRIDAAAFEAGIVNAEWPARMQRLASGALVNQAPAGCEIWLDGGHNAEGGRVVAAALGDLEERVSRPLVVIVGMMANKDAGGFLANFAGLTRHIIAVQIPGRDNAMPPDRLADAARALGMRVEISASVEAALGSLARLAYEVPPRILITGSLYLAGHVLAANGTPPG